MLNLSNLLKLNANQLNELSAKYIHAENFISKVNSRIIYKLYLRKKIQQN
jgi:hypothetical protein